MQIKTIQTSYQYALQLFCKGKPKGVVFSMVQDKYDMETFEEIKLACSEAWIEFKEKDIPLENKYE